jgi:hypothetical protein
VLLYRGEQIDRLERSRIGTAWSDKEENAQMSARGVNAVGKGGVIMETTAPANAIAMCHGSGEVAPFNGKVN